MGKRDAMLFVGMRADTFVLVQSRLCHFAAVTAPRTACGPCQSIGRDEAPRLEGSPHRQARPAIPNGPGVKQRAKARGLHRAGGMTPGVAHLSGKWPVLDCSCTCQSLLLQPSFPPIEARRRQSQLPSWEPRQHILHVGIGMPVRSGSSIVQPAVSRSRHPYFREV